MAIGKNRNFTHISREAADAAMPTLSYIPVVAHILEDDDKTYVGGHDYEIVHEGNTIGYRSLTVPYGVVVADSFNYETVTEPDGTDALYLTADVVLWAGRYPEIMDTIYDEDVYWNQSMEITVNSTCAYPEDHRYSDITSYSYSCLTLLGKDDDPEFNTEPCFQSARVEPIKFSLDTEFEQKFNELKYELSNIDMTFANLGGETTMNNEKDNVTLEDAEEVEVEVEVFEAESTDEEAAEEVAEEVVTEALCEPKSDAEEDEEENKYDATEEESEEEACTEAETVTEALCTPEEESEDDEEEPNKFAYSYMEKLKALNECAPESESMCCTIIVDFDDEYVIYNIMDCESYSDVYVRYQYEFDSESLVASLVGEPTEMIMKLITKEENTIIEENRASMEEELLSLRKYKEDIEIMQTKSEIDEVFSEFEDLEAEEEYRAIKDACIEDYSFMSPAEIKEKCYAIRGRKCSTKASYSLDKTEKVKIPASVNNIENVKKSNSRYGDLFEKYGVNK